MDTVNEANIAESPRKYEPMDSLLFGIGHGIAALRGQVDDARASAETAWDSFDRQGQRGMNNLARLDRITNDIALFIQELEDSAEKKTISRGKTLARLYAIYSHNNDAH